MFGMEMVGMVEVLYGMYCTYLHTYLEWTIPTIEVDRYLWYYLP